MTDLSSWRKNANPRLEQLFNETYINTNAPLWQIMVMLIWAPFVLVLVAIRLVFLAILLPALCLKRDWSPWLVRLILPWFGIWVKYRSPSRQTTFPTLVCSNHSTGDLDFFPFMSLMRAGPLVDEAYFASSRLAQIFLPSLNAVPVRASCTREERRALILRELDALRTRGKSLLFFPEGWDTNLDVGLLRYEQFLFSLDLPVAVMALRATAQPAVLLRGALRVNVIDSNPLSQTLWLLFTPWTEFAVEFLGIEQRRSSESSIDFARRVQMLTATAHGILATEFTKKDALKLRRSGN